MAFNCKECGDKECRSLKKEGAKGTTVCFQKQKQSPQAGTEAVSAELALLNCPFCGKPVKMEETEGGDYVIRCCVDMLDDMDWEDDYDGEKNLREKWNKRAI